MAGAAGEENDYPLVGETLGLWRLVRGVGRGGMGEVYAAEYDYLHLLTMRLDEHAKATVRRELEALPRAQQARLASEMLGTSLPAEARFAIKVCNARTGTSGHRRFLQEAEVASRLGEHPYIVTVHAVHGGAGLDSGIERRLQLDRGRFRDVAFMVMDLATRDYDHTRLTIGQAVHVVRCIATALDHAHAQGVVHRDLKPENILGDIDHPLLTDFGIAKEVDHSEGLTRTGQIIGTLDYMSPEQATDAKRVDQRSDIYSLGVVLYEFATQGQLPYGHKQERESLLAAIRSERMEPRWPREHRSDFPVGLERIILKAMAFRQEDRYQAMSDFITDLDRFARGEWIPFWGRVQVRSWTRFQLRAHPKLLWLAASALVAAAVLLVWLWLPKVFDGTRRLVDRHLGALTEAAERIEHRAQNQLGRRERDVLEETRRALSVNPGEYADLRDRLARIELRLARSSRLEALFGIAPPGRPRPTYEEAKAELQVAAGAENPSWHPNGSDGLVVGSWQTLRLGPYGAGTVLAYLEIDLPVAAPAPGALPVAVSEGLRLELREAEDPRHVVGWRVGAGGVLQFTYREDMRQPQVLRQERLPAARRIGLGIELAPGGVRCWYNGREQRWPLRGLRDQAPALVFIDLQKGTQVVRVEVRPEGASGER